MAKKSNMYFRDTLADEQVINFFFNFAIFF